MRTSARKNLSYLLLPIMAFYAFAPSCLLGIGIVHSQVAGTSTRPLALSDNPFRYSSYYSDSESRLYYLKARYYSPKLARFISRDTYDLSNRYAYCDSNPIGMADQNGHSPLAWVLGGTFTLLGAGATYEAVTADIRDINSGRGASAWSYVDILWNVGSVMSFGADVATIAWARRGAESAAAKIAGTAVAPAPIIQALASSVINPELSPIVSPVVASGMVESIAPEASAAGIKLEENIDGCKVFSVNAFDYNTLKEIEESYSPERYMFRQDNRLPRDIERAGGFYPKAFDSSKPEGVYFSGDCVGLQNHSFGNNLYVVAVPENAPSLRHPFFGTNCRGRGCLKERNVAGARWGSVQAVYNVRGAASSAVASTEPVLAVSITDEELASRQSLICSKIYSGAWSCDLRECSGNEPFYHHYEHSNVDEAITYKEGNLY